jgi:hypothetical protein
MFSDNADLSQWPMVTDGGQAMEISNIPAPPQVIAGVAVPAGVGVGQLQYVNGVVNVIEPAPAPVPQMVTSFQAKAALANADLYAAVNTWMTTKAPLIDQLAWQETKAFRRGDTMIANLAGPLGLSDAQLDALFIAAAQIAL